MLRISKICPLRVQKIQNRPKFLPKPSQNLPKTLPKRPKIHPEAFLEPIMGQCLKEARFWTSKKRPRGGQKHPKEAQDGPKPFPNTALDPPKIDFCWIFGRFLSSSKFAKIFLLFVHYFLQSEPLKTMVFPQQNHIFYKISFFQDNWKNRRKIVSKSSQNPPQTTKNRAKIKKKQWKKPTWVKTSQKCGKNSKNCEKIAQHGPKSPPKGRAPFVQRSPRCPVWPLT